METILPQTGPDGCEHHGWKLVKCKPPFVLVDIYRREVSLRFEQFVCTSCAKTLNDTLRIGTYTVDDVWSIDTF